MVVVVGKLIKELWFDGLGYEGNSEDCVDIDCWVVIGLIKELVFEICSEYGVDVDVILFD